MKIFVKNLGLALGIFLFGCNNKDINNNADIDNREVINYDKMSYQEVINSVKTPAQARAYIKRYITPIEDKETKSFKRIHETRSGDCGEAVIASMALLNNDGYALNYL